MLGWLSTVSLRVFVQVTCLSNPRTVVLFESAEKRAKMTCTLWNLSLSVVAQWEGWGEAEGHALDFPRGSAMALDAGEALRNCFKSR